MRSDGSKVLVVHPSPDLYGSDRMVLESVRAFAALWTVCVAVPEEGPLCDRLRAAGAEVLIAPTPVLRKAMLSPAGLLHLIPLALRTLPRMLTTLRRVKPAAIYVNTVTIPLWILAARVAGVPVLCHVHEAESSVSALLRHALALPLRLAHQVVANSRAAELALAESGLRRSGRVRVIYNGVPGPPAPAPLGTESAGRLLVVGRLSPRKGSDVAVRAALTLRARGHDVSLTLVGDVFPGYEWYERQLRTLAAKTHTIVFAGFHDPVWDAFAETDVVLVPSRVEPFGNVAVEAMLAGRPVIASKIQGLTEIVRDGQNGLLVPVDEPEALADAVAKLLADRPLSGRLAEQGRRDALARFSLDRYHNEMRAALAGIAKPVSNLQKSRKQAPCPRED